MVKLAPQHALFLKLENTLLMLPLLGIVLQDVMNALVLLLPFVLKQHLANISKALPQMEPQPLLLSLVQLMVSVKPAHILLLLLLQLLVLLLLLVVILMQVLLKNVPMDKDPLMEIPVPLPHASIVMQLNFVLNALLQPFVLLVRLDMFLMLLLLLLPPNAPYLM